MVDHVSVWCIVKQNPADKEPADFTPTHPHTHTLEWMILYYAIIL